MTVTHDHATKRRAYSVIRDKASRTAQIIIYGRSINAATADMVAKKLVPVPVKFRRAIRGDGYIVRIYDAPTWK